MRAPTRTLWLGMVLLAACRGSRTGVETVRLATTTSVVDSGFLDVVTAALEKQGVRLAVAAVGSGQALERLGKGEADLAITHSPDQELEAVQSGKVARRTPFMKNDFVIVGPVGDAAVVTGSATAREAMRRIAASGKPFISRGDQSGTHLRELALWRRAEVAETGFIVSTGAGMGATLARASQEKAFTLCDRGTFLAKKKDLGLVIVYQGNPELENVYSLIETARPSDGARKLVELLRSPEGKALIGGYGVAKLGEPLFTPID